MDEPGFSEENEFKPPRRRGIGFSLLVTVFCLGLTLYLLYGMRSDLAYWRSVGQPIDLGSPGAYQLDLARDNAYARIKGSPGVSADHFTRYGQHYQIVAVKGTHILVRQSMKDADIAPPKQQPFVAQGRLILDTSMPAYAHAFEHFAQRGESMPRAGHLFVLLDGEIPHQGYKTPCIIGALIVLAGINALALIRFVTRRSFF